MSRLLSLIAALMLLAMPAGATDEQIVAGLSQNRVSIDATFIGSEILIFGAVKRDSPAPKGELGVVITVEGPSRPIIVRRKERRLGIWMNTDALEIRKAPSFYAVATSAPFEQLISPQLDHKLHVSIPEMIGLLGAGQVADPQAFADAAVRIREADGHYLTEDNGIYVSQGTLFNTQIKLPANLTEGQYKARLLIIRNKQVIDEHITYIDVRKVGLERWLYNLAYDQPLLYGLMSLAIAIFAGWGASAFFRMIFRQ